MGSEAVIVTGPWSFGLVTLGLLVVQDITAQVHGGRDRLQT